VFDCCVFQNFYILVYIISYSVNKVWYARISSNDQFFTTCKVFCYFPKAYIINKSLKHFIFFKSCSFLFLCLTDNHCASSYKIVYRIQISRQFILYSVLILLKSNFIFRFSVIFPNISQLYPIFCKIREYIFVKIFFIYFSISYIYFLHNAYLSIRNISIYASIVS
jgi:hypothetical protein